MTNFVFFWAMSKNGGGVAHDQIFWSLFHQVIDPKIGTLFRHTRKMLFLTSKKQTTNLPKFEGEPP